MSAKAPESFLLQFLECPVCLQTFKDPKLLPCGHTFCHDCIVKFEVNARGKITCPKCRALMDIPNAGFLPNYMAKEMLSQMTHQKPTKTLMVICEDCEQSVTSEHIRFCTDCGDAGQICTLCFVKYHNGHQNLPFSDLADKEFRKIASDQIREIAKSIEVYFSDKQEEEINLKRGMANITLALDKSNDIIKHNLDQMHKKALQLGEASGVFIKADVQEHVKGLKHYQFSMSNQLYGENRILEHYSEVTSKNRDLLIKLQGMLPPNTCVLITEENESVGTKKNMQECWDACVKCQDH